MLEQPLFGHRLRELRNERGLSQAALAGDEMSTGYLSRLESGARKPTERIVGYLARRLDVAVEAFAQPATRPLAQVLASVTSAAESEETATVLADAIKAEGDHNPALRWQALWLLIRIIDRLGLHHQALAHLSDLTGLADELGVPELRARARTQAARCLRALGDVGPSFILAGEAHAIAEEHQLSVQDRALALLTLVSAEAESGRLQDARGHAELLCALAEGASGTLPVEAWWAAATVCIRQGDNRGAELLLDKALQALDSHDDLIMWMRLRLAAASLSLQMTPPRTEAASGHLAEAEVAMRLVGSARHRQELQLLQAQLAYHEGRMAEAKALSEQLRYADSFLSFRDQVRLDVLCSHLLVVDGRADEAIDKLRGLAQQANERLNVDLAAEVWRTMAETLADLQTHDSPRPGA